ncbi:MAG: hypothetical protein ABEJ79_00730 [Halolamina sp.]
MSDDPDADSDSGSGADAGTDTDPDVEFAAELADARATLSSEDLTAFHVGAVHDDESVDVSFAQVAGDPQQEGLQALTLLAAHLRVVARQADVDLETVAADAVTLAGEVDEVAAANGANGVDGADED